MNTLPLSVASRSPPALLVVLYWWWRRWFGGGETGSGVLGQRVGSAKSRRRGSQQSGGAQAGGDAGPGGQPTCSAEGLRTAGAPATGWWPRILLL